MRSDLHRIITFNSSSDFLALTFHKLAACSRPVFFFRYPPSCCLTLHLFDNFGSLNPEMSHLKRRSLSKAVDRSSSSTEANTNPILRLEENHRAIFWAVLKDRSASRAPYRLLCSLHHADVSNADESKWIIIIIMSCSDQSFFCSQTK